LADGGRGGASILHPGGPGGAGFSGADGGDGALLSAGGGGAAGGGRGGSGSGGLFPGEGGTGGTAANPNGGNGGDAAIFISSGGGGGGGFNGNGSGAASLVNIGALVGGNGGRGGDAALFDGSGGGGGGGGYGAIVTGNAGVSINVGLIAAGDGGRGGTGKDLIFVAGSGGDGGTGLQFTTSGAAFYNIGAIIGGTGGQAGRDRFGAFRGSPGAGGIGVVGAGLTFINGGTVIGGLSGNGSRTHAIAFTGGTNILELHAGSTIVGNVVAASSADTLRLGGAAGSSFNVAEIGPGAQYRGFGIFEKTGSSTWTLTSTTAAITPWSINGGTLAISSDGNLGATTGALTFDGGALQALSSLVLDPSRSINLNGGGGTFNTSAGVTLSAPRPIGGHGGLTKIGAGTMTLGAANRYTGGTTVNGGTLALASGSGSLDPTGDLTINDGIFDLGENVQTVRALSGSGGAIALGTGTLTTNSTSNATLASVITGAGGLVKQGAGTLTLTGNNLYTGGTIIADGVLQVGNGGTTGSLGSGNVFNQASLLFNRSDTFTVSNAISGTGSVVKLGVGTMILTSANSYSGGTIVSAGVLSGNATSLQGNILNSASVVFDQASAGTYAGTMSGGGSLTKVGAGTLVLSGTNSYSGGTTVSAGILQGTTASLQGNILNNAIIIFDQAGTGTYAGAMSGSGNLTKDGTGTLILTGLNSYAGGTMVNGGVLQGNSISLQGNILNNATVVFNQTGTGTYAGNMSGSGGMALQGGGALTLTGINTYTGPTTVTGSTLYANGTLTSGVALDAASVLRGVGTIGGFVSNGGTLSPGNSVGTLTVTGNFVSNGGAYQVEVNSVGQNDRVNVGGSATINGGTVRILTDSGTYNTSQTYTILNATGGVTGTYSNVTENFAFLTPSLAYDANSVFLTLALVGNAFSGFEGNTPNQRAVGYALDQSYANATGDFATVIGALAGLNTQLGPYALNQISGQPWANFGTANLASNTLFMNALGQQMALARGGVGSGQRLALAQACEVEACDAASPFSVWASGLGGFGSVQGDGNSSTFTYNLGGAAAGIDYRVMPNLLLGIGAGYTSGTQWTDTFSGKGWTNAVSVAAYGSFTMAGFHADLLAGYAYSSNQLQRQVTVPGLQPRTANGSTGANQFLGQAEIGYQVPVYAPAQASITPFARLQVMSINQAALSEWGANSLSLNVQQQTTNSVRSTLGAQLNGAIGLGDTRTLDMALRLGWLHEYAYTGRPVTAAFAGAPAAGFTVYGATPQRDAAAIGFQASTNVAAATQIFFRYDGDIGSGTDNHALNVGLRLSW
jgi:autotransporter-associated beta strand protein